MRDQIDLTSGFGPLQRAQLIGEPLRGTKQRAFGIGGYVVAAVLRVREVRDFARRGNRASRSARPSDDVDPVRLLSMPATTITRWPEPPSPLAGGACGSQCCET